VYDSIPLSLMEPGQSGRIDALLGCPDHIHRLEELGVRRGCLVEMVQPGSPCIVWLGGTKICFRDADLFSILVRPGATA